MGACLNADKQFFFYNFLADRANFFLRHLLEEEKNYDRWTSRSTEDRDPQHLVLIMVFLLDDDSKHVAHI